MNKVELLAPAGNYDGLRGAIQAGADAVYLGGDRFSARAYADNFDKAALIKGIHYAHLFGRRVYLTLNTLIKESEFSDIYEYVSPLYEAGLDGIIVQDAGVLRYVRKQFPGMELHASTQMNVTGAYGAAFLKKEGVTRIVPARELSLSELKQIRGTVDIELETFIHGALCYSYSGQCLFSSILGGRSGNRGRCAQPCRLPFRKDNGEWYPLSMKDLCVIDILPELIAAGINSFKIEGRMKKPEYAAGVTGVYRKYIDLFYQTGAGEYHVLDEDRDFLRSLYIRTQLSEGYYNRHNGKDMLTLDKPGYSGSMEEVLEGIRCRYIDNAKKIEINGYGVFMVGKAAAFTVSDGNTKECSSSIFTAEGEVVLQALNQPLDEEMVRKQLIKSGNTDFHLKNIRIMLDDHAFMTVKAINELRRLAIAGLEAKLLSSYYRTIPQPVPEGFDSMEQQASHRQIHVLISGYEQWKSAVACKVSRIYIAIDIWEQRKKLQKAEGQEWFIVLPHIIRLKDSCFLEQYKILLEEDIPDGVMVSNMEGLEWLHAIGYSGSLVTDASLYVWNRSAQAFWDEKAGECYLPPELNEYELKELKGSLQVYGRIPMMISANCIRKTEGVCNGKASDGFLWTLTDRYGKKFPVYNNCKHCYNIIYNTVPLSLHDGLKNNRLSGIRHIRLDFTTEDGTLTKDTITYFTDIAHNCKRKDINPPYQEYTTGHFKRGVD